MRYGHQQKSEIEAWPIEDVFEFYDEIHELVKAENGKSG